MLLGRPRCLCSSLRFCLRIPKLGPDLFLQGCSDQLVLVCPGFSCFSTKKPSFRETPQSQANQDRWSPIKESPWEVEWLQSDQKGYATCQPAGPMPGAKEKSGWLAGPSPRHVGCSIEGHCWFLQGELVTLRQDCTQLGRGMGEGGSSGQWLDCSHQVINLPRAGPRHRKERHM